ncbi:GrpE protein-like protein 1 mitochondrial [Bienertia sinuspersici]
MSLARAFGRTSRTALTQCRNYFHSSSTPAHHHDYTLSLLCNRFHSLSESSSKRHCFPLLWNVNLCNPEQEQGTPAEKKGENSGADAVDGEASTQSQETGSTSDSQPTSQSVKRRRRGSKRTAFSDSDSEKDMDDLSREDLMKLVLEKEEVLENKQNEFTEWKDKFLRSYAEMENVMERTRRDAENSKKFAIQSFAKNLLDVADNLGRAASVTKESFSKIDASEDTVGAMPLLKTLLEGVEMTEKQLAEVFRKAGIEKYDPTDEQFDPNRHNAVFQVPDASKDPGTVAVVLKAGYSLHDRIIRPAEVGVTVAVENNEADS